MEELAQQSPTWQRYADWLVRRPWWLGPLVSLSLVVALELFDVWEVGPQLASVLMFAIFISAAMGGRRAAVVSTVLVFAYAIVDWHILERWPALDTPAHMRLIFLAIVTPTGAFIIGYLEELARGAILALRADITEREVAEGIANSALQQLNSVMRYSPDLICKFDRQGRVILVSDASATILGYTPAELVGMSFVDLVLPDDIDKTIHAGRTLIADGKAGTFENRWLHKSGRPVTLLWTSAWDPVMSRVHATARDVTQQREAEALAERERKKLSALQGLLSVCAWCNKIRNESEEWEKLDQYVERHSHAQVSHAMCPDCLAAKYPGA